MEKPVTEGKILTEEKLLIKGKLLTEEKIEKTAYRRRAVLDKKGKIYYDKG